MFLGWKEQLVLGRIHPKLFVRFISSYPLVYLFKTGKLYLGTCMKQIRQLALYLCSSSALCKQLHSRAMRLFTHPRIKYGAGFEYEINPTLGACRTYDFEAKIWRIEAKLSPV